MSYREERKFSLKNVEISENAGVDFTKYESTEDLTQLWRDTLEEGMQYS